MICREFNDNIIEYAAGRLPADQSARMQAHAATCAQCAAIDREERELRRQFRAMAPIGECPDLWPQLAARLQPPAPRPSFFPRVWAFGGAFAACAAACLALLSFNLTRPGPVPSGPVVSAAEERRIVAKVSETREMASAESEAMFDRIENSRDRERVILLGGGGQ